MMKTKIMTAQSEGPAIMNRFFVATGLLLSFFASAGQLTAADAPPMKTTLDLGGGVKLELVLAPAGKFVMGSPNTEAKRSKNESPQREVAISKAFFIGAYEVTQEQFESVMGVNPSKFKGARNPVENVNWDEAVKFCQKLAAKTGKTCRLPTEAEWEYACRAGSKTAYCNGDDAEGLKKVGWCSYDGKWGSAKTTKPVGSFQPNAWGLYDMHGNVWEWCSDWYAETYSGAGDTDPHGPPEGKFRVIRGGVWNDFPYDCRSAKREWRDPAKRTNGFGIRVVMEK
jgi:formylglycine-generating enzyme required for sulfatase activity